MSQISFPTEAPRFEMGDQILRGVEPEDANDLYQFMSDKDVTQFTSLHAKTPEQVASWIAMMQEQFHKQRAIYWVIANAHKNQAIGRCHFLSVNAEHKRGEIGYYLAKPYWGQGIATQSVTTIVRYGFTHLNLNKIEATAISKNLASTRVLEKVGFKKDGTLRQHTFKNGTYYDVDTFSILKDT